MVTLTEKERGLRAEIKALADEIDTGISIGVYGRLAIRLRAILARHPVEPSTPAPEATVVEEWGWRCTDGERDPARKFGAGQSGFNYGPLTRYDALMRAKESPSTRSLVRRTRTTYADTVTEWEEVR